MSDIKPDTFPKFTPNPIFNGLSDYIKDPQNYMKIQKALLDTLSSTCNHGEVVEMAECIKCTKGMKERRALMGKLGFKSVNQYMAWRKVMEYIHNPPEKVPMMDWKKENAKRKEEEEKDG